MSYSRAHICSRLQACACFLMLASTAAVSCAAKLPVGTVDGRAHSRFAGEVPALARSAPSEGRHVVQPGETLWRIATQNGLTVDELARANGISDPTQIRVGQELRVPGAGASSLALERARALADGGAQAGPSVAKAESDPQPSEAKPVARAEPPKASQGTSAKKPPGRVSVAQYPLRWPLRGKIGRSYGRRGKKHHDGIDILANSGEPVRAAGAGKVVFADEHGGYGKLVLLRHDSGLITVYAHQSELLVKKGERVRGGDVIAKVGATGSAESPHLHFEVRKGIESKNPLQFLPP